MPVWTLIDLLAAFLFVWLTLLAFVLMFPRQWAAFIDREHDCFLRRGIVSRSVSEGFKRLEKGIVFRFVLASTIIIALMNLTLVVLRYVFGFRV